MYCLLKLVQCSVQLHALGMIDKPFVEFDSDAVRLVTEKRDIFMNYSFYQHFFEHFSKAKALSLMEHFSGIFSEYYYFFLRDNKNGKKHEIPEIFELNLNTALHRIFWCCIKTIHFQQDPTSGLLSMLRSDWLSYYQAICYSPLVAKSAGLLAAKKD